MSDGRGFARRVTLDNIDQFAPLLQRRRSSADANHRGGNDNDQTELDEANVAEPTDPALAAAEALFNGQSLRIDLPYRRRRTEQAKARGAGLVREDQAFDGPTIGTPVVEHGELVWRKPRLDASSVQRQPGNPTGGIRLTQARFKVRGKVIDQTQYFRHAVFGDLKWTVTRRNPYREGAVAEFEVILRGQYLGRHRLEISHKPSGEAGQGNYTTIIHWGALGDQVREMDLRNRQLDLYAPLKSGDPFLLEVT